MTVGGVFLLAAELVVLGVVGDRVGAWLDRRAKR